MRIIAKREGYDGNKLRRPGEVFDWPGKACPPWAVPVDGSQPAAAEDQEGFQDLAKQAEALGIAVKKNWGAPAVLRAMAEHHGIAVPRSAKAEDIRSLLAAAGHLAEPGRPGADTAGEDEAGETDAGDGAR